MALSSLFCHPQFPFKIDYLRIKGPCPSIIVDQGSLGVMGNRFSQQQFGRLESRSSEWSFVRGSGEKLFSSSSLHRKVSRVNISCMLSSQIVSNVFTMSTAAVLPIYGLMVLAPRAELTRKLMESSIPFVVLGFVYAYLLYHSWTPNMFRYLFASKYLLPELSGIAKMFSSETTLASAWIHLLTVDLFAARQIFDDGMKNGLETRHSICLCLLFCPLGITVHMITKALAKNGKNNH